MTSNAIKDETTDAPGVLEAGRLNEVLDIYEDLMNTIWAKIVPTLGAVTVVTIMRRSVGRASSDHPALEGLDISDSGLKLDGIRVKAREVDIDEIKSAFKGLVANLFDILAKLTGTILVEQLAKDVDGFEVP